MTRLTVPVTTTISIHSFCPADIVMKMQHEKSGDKLEIASNKTRTQCNSSGRDHEMVEISFGSFSMQIIFVALYHSQVATSHLLVTLVSMWSVCAGVASLFHCVRNSWSAESSIPICTDNSESYENITAHRSKKVTMVLEWRKVHWCKVKVSSCCLMDSQGATRQQYTVNG